MQLNYAKQVSKVEVKIMKITGSFLQHKKKFQRTSKIVNEWRWVTN